MVHQVGAILKRFPYSLAWALLTAAAVVLPVGLRAHAQDIDSRRPAADASFGDSIEPLHLLRGYRSALGLKAARSDLAALGHSTASALLLARYAQTAEIRAPLVYGYEQSPSGPGLRRTGQTSGVVIRGGDRWSASFESSTSTDTLTAGSRTALLTQFHAPLFAGAGVSIGLRYSASLGPAYGIGGGDAPLINGYTLLPARQDFATQQVGYQLQFNYLYGERNAVAVTYNSRREPDQYPFALDSLGVEGRQLSLTGEHWFSPSWALRYDIGAAEPGNQMRRQGLRLGVHYRF